jgi:hypothetical protein
MDVLPNQVFFDPLPKFIDWVKSICNDRVVIDVGCGVGRVVRVFNECGLKACGVDLYMRENPECNPYVIDAHHFPFLPGMLVLICRPNRVMGVDKIVELAIRRGAEIVYVGIHRNLDLDIRPLELKYDVEFVMENAGHEHEVVYLIRRKMKQSKNKQKRLKTPKSKPISTLPPGVKPRRIVTAIIVDMMGCMDQTPEEEIEDHTERFSQLLAPAVLDIHTPKHAGTGGDYGIKETTELVIFDFGGMMPGTSLMEDNAREIVKWADNHPNGLVIVASSFTYTHFVKYEMEELGLDLFNIICDDCSGDDEALIPEWFKK